MHPPSKRTRARAALVALIPALVLSGAPSATAEVTNLYDAKKDGVRILGQGKHGASADGDIRKVRVDYRRYAVKVKIVGHKSKWSNGVAALYDVWVDTQGAGFPEYVIQWNLETERVYVSRANRFTFGKPVCEQPMEEYNFKNAQFTVPRSCLGRPARLRVGVRARDNDTTIRTDWAPGFRRYGPWTRRG